MHELRQDRARGAQEVAQPRRALASSIVFASPKGGHGIVRVTDTADELAILKHEIVVGRDQAKGEASHFTPFDARPEADEVA